jgi:3-methyladenine DNA glycosylase AlkD
VTEPVLARLSALFEADRDPVRAASARAYLRDQFDFLGIPAPRQRELARQATAGAPRPTEAGLLALADACWARPEREYQYFACAQLRRHAATLTPDALPALRRLITTKPWWDTVDALASRVVGPLVSRHGTALRLLHAAGGAHRLLRPQGDRLGAAGVREDRPRSRPGVRGGRPALGTVAP